MTNSLTQSLTHSLTDWPILVTGILQFASNLQVRRYLTKVTNVSNRERIKLHHLPSRLAWSVGWGRCSWTLAWSSPLQQQSQAHWGDYQIINQCISISPRATPGPQSILSLKNGYHMMIPRAEEGDPVDIRIMDFDPFFLAILKRMELHRIYRHICVGV